MAALAGITASTLRGYITRRENSVPQPQANVSGRSMWSKSVAADWTEARRRSAEGVREMFAGQDDAHLSLAAAAARKRYAKSFHAMLWERPDIRKRWVLRHRNEQAVTGIADDLAWYAANDLDRFLPPELLIDTVRHAVLDQFGQGLGDQETDRAREWGLTLTHQVARMLDWLIQHQPDAAQRAIGCVLRDMKTGTASRPQRQPGPCTGPGPGEHPGQTRPGELPRTRPARRVPAHLVT
ncbi:hypothetical protein OEIGOIKO_00111 [Streptomyces chrestomyceticus JCM 4735]|uniref:Uncharacterized protein n=1 Tax=Streptomyces chrestomyceticus JCM 4735 TaxID=1306181 RepID=A0A7U9KPI3_9ACTN|nr:hypothetical protein [Streptomyces chrestomyceticus]GCD32398.1 hypothetical protein OEIGOIKO_00111 [Streptomyces chrestomyceticus JCM 4735]